MLLQQGSQPQHFTWIVPSPVTLATLLPVTTWPPDFVFLVTENIQALVLEAWSLPLLEDHKLMNDHQKSFYFFSTFKMKAIISGAQKCPNPHFCHFSYKAHCSLSHSQQVAFFKGSTCLLKAPLIPWKLSAITAMNFKSFSSNYCSSLEIMTQLLTALKCQVDHSEIQARFLQEGPSDKTFYKPSILSLFPNYTA